MHPQSSTNESPFSLVYDADAMIPVEIGEPSLRRELYDPTHNHQNMALHLNLLPELREKAQIRNLAASNELLGNIMQICTHDHLSSRT